MTKDYLGEKYPVLERVDKYSRTELQVHKTIYIQDSIEYGPVFLLFFCSLGSMQS